MDDPGLMSIGAFARRTGLTASAVRFYGDSGVLAPAEVDAVSGYRLYEDGQVDRGILIRRLREIGVSLDAVRSILDSTPAEAVRAVENHLRSIVDGTADALRRSAEITASLAGTPGTSVAVVRGPVLSTAIDQVLSATTRDPALPVLDGVLLESAPGSATLTATDRFRLATRSFVTSGQSPSTWSGVLAAEDLRSGLSMLRRLDSVEIVADPHLVRLRSTDGSEVRCRVLTEDFPDHRVMLAGLPDVATRIIVEAGALVRALEAADSDSVLLDVGGTVVAVAGSSRSDAPVQVDAHTVGPDVALWFAMTTLYPAVTSTIGSDLLIEVRAPDLPATIRSADSGDLTILAMPIARPLC